MSRLFSIDDVGMTIELEDEHVYERCGYRGKYDCTNPLVYRIVDLAAFAQVVVVVPYIAVKELGYVGVIYQRQANKQPQVAGPYDEKQQVSDACKRKFGPLVREKRFYSVHVSVGGYWFNRSSIV